MKAAPRQEEALSPMVTSSRLRLLLMRVMDFAIGKKMVQLFLLIPIILLLLIITET